MGGKKLKIELENQNINDTYQLEEALLKGTLFKGLYKPYKYEPNQFIYKDKEERALGIIRQLRFAIIELNLYLDNHPKCPKGLQMMSMLSAEYDKMLDYYEKNYGRLMASSSYQNDFCYATNRWPWEVNS